MVRGKDDPVYRRIVHDFNSLVSEKIKLEDVRTANSYPIRGGHPRYDVWQVWFKRHENAIIFLEIQNEKGDKNTGTGFYIGNNTIITAGHNLLDKLKITKMYAGKKELQFSRKRFIPKNVGIDIGTITTKKKFPFKNTSLSCHFRLPEIGEEIAAIGFPVLPLRFPSLVLHIGVVEALPVSLSGIRFIQVSFQSGGGLSGGPLLDKRGNVLGIMVENIFQETKDRVPSKPFGQAIPIEYSSALVANTQS